MGLARGRSGERRLRDRAYRKGERTGEVEADGAGGRRHDHHRRPRRRVRHGRVQRVWPGPGSTPPGCGAATVRRCCRRPHPMRVRRRPRPRRRPRARGRAPPSRRRSICRPPVLAGADRGVRPDPAKVKAKIAGVRVKNVNGRLSGSVLEVTSGAAVFRQQAGRALIPASTMKLLTSAAALSASRAGPHLRHLGGQPEARPVDLGRRRGSLSDQAIHGRHLPQAGLGGRPGQEHRDGAAQGQDQERPAGLRRAAVRRPGLEPELAQRLRQPGDTRLGPLGGRGPARRPDPRARERTTRPGRPPRRTRRRCASRGSGSAVVGKAKAPRTADRVASVSSMPLERIVEQVLMVSDNDARRGAVPARGGGEAATGFVGARPAGRSGPN